MTKFFLRKKAGNRIVNGHPWVFANEIGDSVGNFEPGDIVELYSYSGTFIGKGFVNPASQIRIRLLCRKKESIIDAGFFLDKITQAKQYREQLGFTENYRLIHAEADGLPGLVIDKYNNYFVVQSQSLGMDKWLPQICEALQQLYAPKGIYLRNDNPIRQLEQAPLSQDFLSAPFDTNISIVENDIKLYIDLKHGDKTGYYLDHAINRTIIKDIVKDAEVLDAFCFTGSFALHAAIYGAKNATGIDNNADAIELATKNAAENNLTDKCAFQTTNAFDTLKLWANEHKKFDVIILDPPLFGIGKTTIQKATSAYKELNLRAMKLLHKGGFLLTCSRTNIISTDDFRSILQSAAKDAGKQLKQVAEPTQSPDHPIDWNILTTRQLNAFLLQVQ